MMLVAKNIAALPGSTRFSNAVNQHLYIEGEAGKAPDMLPRIGLVW